MVATMRANPRTIGIAVATGYSVARGGTLQASVTNMPSASGINAEVIEFGTWTDPPVVGGGAGDRDAVVHTDNVIGWASLTATDNGDDTSNVTVSQVVPGGAAGVAADDVMYAVVYDGGDSLIQALAGPFVVVA